MRAAIWLLHGKKYKFFKEKIVATTPLGTKRTCPSCANRFYDLNHHPAVCPKCHHRFDPAAALRTRRRAERRSVADPRAADLLVKAAEDAKAAANRVKAKKAASRDEEVFDDELESIPGGGDIEPIDDIDDIDSIEEIEESVEEELDDDIVLEDEDVGGEVLIDDVDEVEGDEDAEEEEEEAPKKGKGKKKR